MVEINNTLISTSSIAKNSGLQTLPFLMTDERSQVLDLIKHLISHFSDTIVFCGPNGVGKTRLLQYLQQQGIASCHFHWLVGNKDMTIETLLEQLNPIVDRHRFGTPDRLFADAPANAMRSSAKTVLVIDEAGALAPGLCEQLIFHAEQKTYLVIIFVLTHDQLQLKHLSDPGIDDCHIVELSPLTEKQCGEFLQHLSAQTQDAITVDLQSEAALPEIFRHTHGIPSKIIEKYVVTPVKTEENPTRLLLMVGSVLIVIALASQWYSSTRTLVEVKTEPVVAKESGKSADYEVTQPILSLPIAETEIVEPARHMPEIREVNSVQISPLSKDAGQSDPIDTSPEMTIQSKQETAGNQLEQSRTEVQPDQVADAKINIKTEAEPEFEANQNDNPYSNEASAWLSSQPAQNYTLQLMVLSKQQSVFDVLDQYSGLSTQIKYVKRNIGDKQKYVLLYGSFADARQALSAKQQMPVRLQTSIARKIAAIRKEFP